MASEDNYHASLFCNRPTDLRNKLINNCMKDLINAIKEHQFYIDSIIFHKD